MTDPMQAAVEVLARALASPFGTPPMDGDFAKASAILAEIAPLIVAEEREACANACQTVLSSETRGETKAALRRVQVAIRGRGKND